ncbi:lipopolysaccharide-induced tumor necrosis factor-alpha factor-like protein [Leptotrombidium deliense]|uniref:Lipopolysaccharide-induced tumor necrosis factor-alpha factor-like protein n=1 Tax=Leptotrombidium deliense TaxID=299467 RepID=A0A443RXT0_9ACAR|nr:lipopolysaccharide-induced tumor necrosis factor-alpha factor-like protein [Leptotrombidium deliense]
MYNSEFVPPQPPPNYSEHPYPDQFQPGFPQRTAWGPAPINTQPTRTIIVATNDFGPFPTKAMCPRCNCEILTQTRPLIGIITWLIAGGLCVVGCIPCCLIPFFVQTCQDCEHRCSVCQSPIGVYKRMC